MGASRMHSDLSQRARHACTPTSASWQVIFRHGVARELTTDRAPLALTDVTFAFLGSVARWVG